MAKGTGKSKQENKAGLPSKKQGKKSGGGRDNEPEKPKGSSNLPKGKGEKKG